MVDPRKTTKKNKKSGRATPEDQFPGRLHALLDYVEQHQNNMENNNNNNNAVISWVLHGRGFVIHNPGNLERLLPLFFKQTKYKSFRRQLNNWYFQRIHKGPHNGVFMHPYFVQGDLELCSHMSRNVDLKPSKSSLPQKRSTPSSLDSSTTLTITGNPQTKVRAIKAKTNKDSERKHSPYRSNEDDPVSLLDDDDDRNISWFGSFPGGCDERNNVSRTDSYNNNNKTSIPGALLEPCPIRTMSSSERKQQSSSIENHSTDDTLDPFSSLAYSLPLLVQMARRNLLEPNNSVNNNGSQQQQEWQPLFHNHVTPIISPSRMISSSAMAAQGDPEQPKTFQWCHHHQHYNASSRMATPTHTSLHPAAESLEGWNKRESFCNDDEDPIMITSSFTSSPSPSTMQQWLSSSLDSMETVFDWNNDHQHHQSLLFPLDSSEGDKNDTSLL